MFSLKRKQHAGKPHTLTLIRAKLTLLFETAERLTLFVIARSRVVLNNANNAEK